MNICELEVKYDCMLISSLFLLLNFLFSLLDAVKGERELNINVCKQFKLEVMFCITLNRIKASIYKIL